jgi:homoserine O-succinyltransferase/O-acetyltransferase
MSLIIDGRVPTRWATEGNGRFRPSGSMRSADFLRIVFINNMPDAALEDTELQFFTLIDAAAGASPVAVKLYSLPGVPRGERGQVHLASFYNNFDEIWQSEFDGVIITGTEPLQSDLRDEPYWRTLSATFDWAERNTSSALLSCLAAHASVLHGDGIQRHRLPDKQFGVFASEQADANSLLDGCSGGIRFPHSRWNEVREEELIEAGYLVLTKSADAGVDTFVKKKRNSLFLHFQGHPEYSVHTLFKEYRRDIKRYLNHERDTYPTMPVGYFDVAAEQLLLEFQKTAMAERSEEIMSDFPEAAVTGGLQNGWHTTAAGIYRNWMQYLLARKEEKSRKVLAQQTR